MSEEIDVLPSWALQLVGACRILRLWLPAQTITELVAMAHEVTDVAGGLLPIGAPRIAATVLECVARGDDPTGFLAGIVAGVAANETFLAEGVIREAERMLADIEPRS